MDGSVILYNAPRLVHWDWRVAADLFLGGIGVGTFLIALIQELYHDSRYLTVSRIAAWCTPLFIGAGGALLMMKLGHPERIWLTVTGFSATSPLSWGGLAQGLLLLISLTYAFCLAAPDRCVGFRHLLAVVGVPVAVAVGGYHGFLLTALRARPLWSVGSATIAALLAFVTSGIAMIALLLCLHPGRQRLLDSIKQIRLMLGGALVLQCLTLFVWWVSLEWGSTTARQALAAANAAYGPLFWYGAVGGGLLAPMLLGVVGLVGERRKQSPVRPSLVALTSLLILTGSFLFRYALVMGGQLR